MLPLLAYQVRASHRLLSTHSTLKGQRRYVESLSAYARQFLGRMSKPEVDFIKGLPPAIAIEQKVISRNPRSTVGTSTEIYEYLRLLYARIGRTFSPISGEEVKHHSVEDVIEKVMSYSEGTKFCILAPLHIVEGRSVQNQLEMEMQEGYARIYVDNDFIRIEDWLEQNPADDNNKATTKDKTKSIYLVIDRLSVDSSKDTLTRLTDSCETAFYEGDGNMQLMILPAKLTYDSLRVLKQTAYALKNRTIICFRSTLPLVLALLVRVLAASSVSMRN